MFSVQECIFASSSFPGHASCPAVTYGFFALGAAFAASHQEPVL